MRMRAPGANSPSASTPNHFENSLRFVSACQTRLRGARTSELRSTLLNADAVIYATSQLHITVSPVEMQPKSCGIVCAGSVIYSPEELISKMKQLVTCAAMAGMMLASAFGQIDKSKLATKNDQSPGKEASVTIGGKPLWIYYHAPSVRARHIFGGAGALQPDD